MDAQLYWKEIAYRDTYDTAYDTAYDNAYEYDYDYDYNNEAAASTSFEPLEGNLVEEFEEVKVDPEQEAVIEEEAYIDTSAAAAASYEDVVADPIITPPLVQPTLEAPSNA